MNTAADPALREALLNHWQQRLPLHLRPFDRMAQHHGCTEARVIELLTEALQQGAVSRVGGVFAPGSGGAGLLCALAVPPERMAAVAALVNAVPGVNHNYAREHAWSMWFVITAPSRELIDERLAALEQLTGLVALRLPMVRPYRINLGFDLRAQGAAPLPEAPVQRARVAPLPADERPLAALLEQGLPLQPRPFAPWAERLGWRESRVLSTLQRWLDEGVLRRLGVIVRHHELGFASNAMCVFDAPDGMVDQFGAQLARQAGVTLCYRRARAEGWPYNLFCMIHGRSREAVLAALDAARQACGLQDLPQTVLFSTQRFLQGGSRYFADALLPWPGADGTDPAIHNRECVHA